MAETSPTPDLTDALVELSFLIQATLSRLAAKHEVTLTQVRLLGILRDREPGIVELAGALNLDKSSASGLVDRAERRGFVKRASGRGTDGRAIRVVLTTVGRLMVNEFALRVAEEISRLAAELSPAQRERLALLAAQIVSSSGVAAGLEAPRSATTPA